MGYMSFISACVMSLMNDLSDSVIHITHVIDKAYHTYMSFTSACVISLMNDLSMNDTITKVIYVIHTARKAS